MGSQGDNSLMLNIVHHPAYDAEFDADHRFPMGKYTALMKELGQSGLLDRAILHAPLMPDPAMLELAHDAEYVRSVFEANVDPKIERLIGFEISRKVADRALLATSGTILAAQLALAHGIACNTAGGSHHARRAHGAGFCTLNDVAVAALNLLSERLAKRILVVDLDVHQGDGTAEILGDVPDVFTLSVHSEKNYPTRKEQSRLDVPLPDAVGDADYLKVLSETLDHVANQFTPDFVFYNAGVDVHVDDRLGRLALTNDGIAARDHAVISRFTRKDIPLCGVIGGGYSKDLDALAKRHALLFHTAWHYC
jgi:acetoin utilization deacetylase AcuC-like enzyme